MKPWVELISVYLWKKICILVFRIIHTFYLWWKTLDIVWLSCGSWLIKIISQIYLHVFPSWWLALLSKCSISHPYSLGSRKNTETFPFFFFLHIWMEDGNFTYWQRKYSKTKSVAPVWSQHCVCIKYIMGRSCVVRTLPLSPRDIGPLLALVDSSRSWLLGKCSTVRKCLKPH